MTRVIRPAAVPPAPADVTKRLSVLERSGIHAMEEDGSCSIGLATGSIRMGAGAPSNSTGSDGDVYFRTDTPAVANQRIYFKSAGSWLGIL